MFSTFTPLLFLGLTCAQWPNPEPCTGDCDTHDPSLVRRTDGKYFRFGSGSNVDFKTAPSISGPWVDQVKGALPHGIQGGAPDVHQVGEVYYMYYQETVIGTQHSNISVASSTTMEVGNWTNHGLVNIPKGTAKNDYNRIDANLLVLKNGSELYLSFGSYWDDIFQLEMENPLKVKTGTLRHLAENVTHIDVNVTPGHPHNNPTEGSSQFAWSINKKMQYFLFFSSGACCNARSDPVPAGDEYKVMVCRSASARGPFVDRKGVSCLTHNGGTLVLGSHGRVYAPGGQGVMYDEGLKSVILYYHYIDSKFPKAQFGWNYLGFDEEGWPIVISNSSSTG